MSKNPKIYQQGRGKNGGGLHDIHPTITSNYCQENNLLIEEDENGIEVIGRLDQSGHDHGKRVHSTEGISPTLTAVTGGTHHIKIFDPKKYRVRKLTPNEYGRLQAFPIDDGWKQVVSDTQAYRQFGNAVTTTVAQSVAEAIKEYLQEIDTKG